MCGGDICQFTMTEPLLVRDRDNPITKVLFAGKAKKKIFSHRHTTIRLWN